MRKKYLVTALLLVLAIILSACDSKTVVTQAPELKEPVGVQADIATAYIGEIYDIEYYDAAVVPYVEPLFFEVNGAIENVYIYPGKKVQKGDILVELNQDALKDRAEALRSDLEYAEIDNAYSDALLELDIELLNTELYQLHQQGAAETQLDLKRNEIAQKEAALRQAKAQRQPDLEAKYQELAEIEAALDENVLRAPFDGTIAHVAPLTNGYWVQAYVPLMHLADDTQLSLSGKYVSSSIFAGADRLYARIGGEDYDIAYQPIDQKEYISAVLSGATLNSSYKILDSTENIHAGQYAAVFVISDYTPDALLVPSGAIFSDSEGKYVYVDENGSRVRRPVTVGMTTVALAQITEGLTEGELVYVND